jgi:archaetidylinositol phosphate synthase
MNLLRNDYYKIYDENEKPASTLFHKYISKKLARYFTYYFLKYHITPNMMSLFTVILITIAGITLNLNIGIFGIIAFLLLLQFSYVLDCSDGVVARITNKSSKFGAFFDVTLDRLNVMIVFFSIGLYHYSTNDFSLISFLLFIISSLLFLQYQIMSSLRPFYFPELKGYMKNKENISLKNKVVKIIYEFIDTGIFYFILSVGILFNYELYIIYFYGLIGLILSIAMYWLLYKTKS